MSPLKSFILTSLAAVFLTAGVLFYLGRVRAREAAVLERKNNRLRFEVSQRRSATSAHSSLAETQVASAVAVTTHATSSTTLQPTAEDYRNEGNATPMAALQTIAWAGDRADTETIRRMITFDPAAREKILTYMSTLPSEIRAQWATSEQMAAMELTHNMIEHPFPRAALLERGTVESVKDDRVMLRLPGTGRDRSEFQRTPEGWKFAITEPLVDRFLAARSKR